MHVRREASDSSGHRLLRAQTSTGTCRSTAMAAGAGAAGSCDFFLSACASSSASASQHPYHRHCGCAIHRLLNGASHTSATCSQVKLRGRSAEPVALSSSLKRVVPAQPDAHRSLQGSSSCDGLKALDNDWSDDEHLFQVSGLVQQPGSPREACDDL